MGGEKISKSNKFNSGIKFQAFLFFYLIISIFNYNLNAKGVGSTSSSFLDFSPFGYNLNLSETYSGNQKNMLINSWNPAGFGIISNKEINLSYLSYLQDISYNYIAYGQPLSNIGTIGISIIRLDYGKIKKTTEDENGNFIDNSSNYSASDFAFGLGYGRSLFSKRINIGFNLKLINQVIDNISDTGYAFDFGFVSNLTSKISFGGSIQNIGIGLFDKPLPSLVKIGLTLTPINNFYISSEIKVPLIEDKSIVFVTAEYLVLQVLNLKIGYKTNYNISNEINFGLGFKISRFDLNYAYLPFSDLGIAHKISLGMKFGAIEKN